MKKNKGISEEERLKKKMLKVARREMNKASHSDFVFVVDQTGRHRSVRIAKNGEVLPRIRKLITDVNEANTKQTKGDS